MRLAPIASPVVEKVKGVVVWRWREVADCFDFHHLLLLRLSSYASSSTTVRDSLANAAFCKTHLIQPNNKQNGEITRSLSLIITHSRKRKLNKYC